MTDEDLPQFDEDDRITVDGEVHVVEVVDRIFEADAPNRILSYRLNPVDGDHARAKLYPKGDQAEDADAEFVLSKTHFFDIRRFDADGADTFVFRGDEYRIVGSTTLLSGRVQYDIEPVEDDTPPANLFEAKNYEDRARLTRYMSVDPDDVKPADV